IFDTINTDVVVLAVLAYVAFLHFTHASGDAQAPDSHRHLTAFAGKGWVTVPLAAAVLFPAFWYTVKRPYDSNVSLTQGIALEKGLDPQSGKMRFIYMEEIGDLFKRADRIQTTGRYEVREEYANYASELAKEPLVPAETKIVVVREALALLEESIRQDPAFARRYMYPSSLINMTFGVLQETHPGLARALAEKTLSWLQRAEGLAPTRPQVFLERGRALASLKRIDEAASAFQVVTKLIPWVKSPHLELFALYVSAGRFEDAAKEREKMAALPLALSVSDYDSLIRLCISRKAFSEAVALYQRRLALTPGDAVAMAHLAATYRDMGDMESARRTALSAAALSPQIAAGLQEFLKTLEDPK
ncbi:MAG TPA: hypothetical protein VE398_00060, partial [Acidobacteriota bacterium]|nr:hypothetical protein [Acidobacteriota bacterium]